MFRFSWRGSGGVSPRRVFATFCAVKKLVNKVSLIPETISSNKFSLTATGGFVFLLLFLFASCSFKQRELGNLYRAPLTADVKGFDPVLTDDLYSHIAMRQVYETLLQYHPLKRPYELMPLLADSLPRLSADRLTYTFRLKPGIYFQDNPCFKGQRREMTADDVVYSIKRLADIKNKRSGWWVFDGRIQGLDDFRKKSASVSPTDYGRPVSGLSAPDRYTLSVILNSPCPQVPYFFAMPFTSVVAREAVEFYGEEFLNHPVGTGPFRLLDWRRQMRLTFVRNPAYHDMPYPCEGSPNDREAGYLDDCKKKIPFLDTLILNIFIEDTPMWLNFLRLGLDAAWIPKDNYDKAVRTDMTLNPEMADKGIVLSKNASLDLTYTCFNMDDPLLGKNV